MSSVEGFEAESKERRCFGCHGVNHKKLLSVIEGITSYTNNLLTGHPVLKA